MNAHAADGSNAVEQPTGPEQAVPARALTITLTGFAASALDLGGDLYLLDLDGTALHYESYVSEATSVAIDALMSTFDSAYSQRHGEIEAVTASVVARALACCHPVTYAEQSLAGAEQSPATVEAAGGTA